MFPAVVSIWGPATRDSLCWRAPAVLGWDREEAELPADSGSRLPVAWSPECPWSYCLATATQPKHTMGRDLWAMSLGPGAPKSGFVKPQEAAVVARGTSGPGELLGKQGGVSWLRAAAFNAPGPTQPALGAKQELGSWVLGSEGPGPPLSLGLHQGCLTREQTRTSLHPPQGHSGMRLAAMRSLPGSQASMA